MLQKNDLLMLLYEIEETNPEAETYIKKLCNTTGLGAESEDTIKFINTQRQFDVAKFYEKLRKSYNSGKSSLYKNLVNENLKLEEVPITLSSYILQVLLYSKNVEDKDLFLKNSRAEEASRVLNNYFSDYNIDDCKTELELIKADIKLFEYIK